MRMPTVNSNVEKAQQFMHERGLTLDDLINVGWESRFQTNPKSAAAEKCRRVEKGWALMARLGVNYVDLEIEAEKLGLGAANPVDKS